MSLASAERQLRRWLTVGCSISGTVVGGKRIHMFEHRARFLGALTPQQKELAISSGELTAADLADL